MFTSQNKSENKNWNYGTHLKLEIENGKQIANRLGNQSAIIWIDDFVPIKFMIFRKCPHLN